MSELKATTALKATTNPDDAVTMVLDHSPMGSGPAVKSAAGAIGVSVWQLVLWFGTHPTAMAKFFSDCIAKDIPSAISDLIAAWNASHQPVAPPSA